MSKIVFTADLHVHPHRVDSRDGGMDRLKDGLSALRQTLEYARQHRCPWVFGGDLKQPRRTWPHDALTGVLSVLREFGDVPKLMVKGNHDGEGPYGCGLDQFHSEALVASEPGAYSTEDAPVLGKSSDFDHVVVAAWPATSEERDLDVFLKKTETFDVLVGHGYVAGAKTGPDDFRAPSSLTIERLGLARVPLRWSVALFGDVHKGQVLARSGRGRAPGWQSFSAFPIGALSGKVPLRQAGPWRGEVYYPGSPYAQNWGEREDGPKGCLLVDLESGEVTFLPVNAPRYVDLDWSERMPSPPPDRASLVPLCRGNFVRVTLGPWAEGWFCPFDAEFLAEARPRTFKLDVVRAAKSERRAEIHGGMSQDEMLRSYVAARPLDVEGVSEDQLVRAGTSLMGDA